MPKNNNLIISFNTYNMTKLTEEEIKKVSDLKIKFNQIVETTGAIEVQIMQLQAQKEELKVSLVDLRKEELVVAK